jgi:hypothetical protein
MSNFNAKVTANVGADCVNLYDCDIVFSTFDGDKSNDFVFFERYDEGYFQGYIDGSKQSPSAVTNAAAIALALPGVHQIRFANNTASDPKRFSSYVQLDLLSGDGACVAPPPAGFGVQVRLATEAETKAFKQARRAARQAAK